MEKDAALFPVFHVNISTGLTGVMKISQREAGERTQQVRALAAVLPEVPGSVPSIHIKCQGIHNRWLITTVMGVPGDPMLFPGLYGHPQHGRHIFPHTI